MTCLKVIGNRASVGFVSHTEVDGVVGDYYVLISIRDNGPTSDEISVNNSATPLTTCPDPPTSFFTVVQFADGNFVVHDHG